MQGTFRRAALAAALGLGVVAGLARTQGVGAIIAPQPYPAVQQPVIVNGPSGAGGVGQPVLGGWTSYPYGVQAPPSTAGAPYPVIPNMIPRPPAPQEMPPPPGRFKAWLNRHNLCCWGSINSAGCGSFHSDFHFIFGSCRKFFGEPCFPDQGPPPWTQLPDYGQKRCACP